MLFCKVHRTFFKNEQETVKFGMNFINSEIKILRFKKLAS